MFVGTIAYELDSTTSSDAQKLLRAELVGRRYSDFYDGRRLPSNCLWIRRNTQGDESVDDLMRRMKDELYAAVEAVKATGLPIRLLRAWVQISGAGTFGLIDPMREKV